MTRSDRRSHRHHALTAAALSLSWIIVMPCARGQEVAAPPESAGATLEGDAEILTRGPVHEAFADPYAQDPENAVVVSREPPEPIDEIPPEYMPEGDNVEWMPGYWGWDDDRDDFIWISGVWRDIPPGQRWMPGAWEQVARGYQWTPGFWMSDEIEEVTYLPQPPPSQEEGPSSPAPDDDHFWVPGVWQYTNNDYAWRPGYWAPAYQDWVWVPDCNIWTPYGYVSRSGYWDRSLPNRGVLYSPVYFPGYQYNGFVPRQVVSVGPMLIHLFVRPGYRHYYFGDYYGNSYAQFGIVPWLGVRQSPYYQYDPLFAFYQTGYFNGRGGFLGRVAGWHNYYQRNPDFRPRRTLADSRSFLNQRGDADENILRQASLTQSIDDVRKSKSNHIALRDVSQEERERFSKNSKEFRNLEKLRREHGARKQRGEQADAGIKLPKVERRRGSGDVPQRPETAVAPRGDDNDPGRRNRARRRENQSENAPDRTARPDRSSDRKPERNAPEAQPGANNDASGNADPDRRNNRDKTRSRRRESQRGGRDDFGLPGAPGGDGAGEAQSIPRPTEPVKPRGQQRETRKPVAPRERSTERRPEQQNRASDRNQQPSAIDQNRTQGKSKGRSNSSASQSRRSNNEPRRGGGDSGQAQPQRKSRSQAERPKGGGKDRKRDKKP